LRWFFYSFKFREGEGQEKDDFCLLPLFPSAMGDTLVKPPPPPPPFLPLGGGAFSFYLGKKKGGIWRWAPRGQAGAAFIPPFFSPFFFFFFPFEGGPVFPQFDGAFVGGRENRPLKGGFFLFVFSFSPPDIAISISDIGHQMGLARPRTVVGCGGGVFGLFSPFFPFLPQGEARRGYGQGQF